MWRESISLHFLIFSPFPLHFLILSPFPRSSAARLQRFVQPCYWGSCQSWSHGCRTCIKRKKCIMVIFLVSDQKINFQAQEVLATCDWASAMWLQQHSEVLFLGGHPVNTFLCTQIKKFTIVHFFSLDACSAPMCDVFYYNPICGRTIFDVVI